MGPLVDTSVIVDAYGGRWTAEVRRFDALMIDGVTPATTPVVVQEVLQGVRDDAQVDVVLRNLGALEELPAPAYGAHRDAARLYRRCRAAGLTPSTIDTLIVTVASVNGRALLTSDQLQRRVAELAGVALA